LASSLAITVLKEHISSGTKLLFFLHENDGHNYTMNW